MSTRLTRRAIFPLAAGSAALLANANATLANGRPVRSQSDSTPVATPGSGETIVYEIPGDAVFPEGMGFDAASSAFYVGSLTTGTVFRGDLASGEVSVFTEAAEQGLTSVTGMNVDGSGRLWVCGASTGLTAVYDTVDGTFIGQSSNGLGPDATFLNDVAITRDGTAYITDSIAPQMTAITATDGQLGAVDVISFEGTSYQYQEGYNADGIVLTDDETTLIIVDIGSGLLYRYELAAGEVSQIDIGGADLSGGDGLALDGDLLYVCRNSAGMIARLRLSEDRSVATLIDEITDPAFAFPTSVAVTGRGTLLVLNAQLDKLMGEPVLPFTVIEIVIPPLAEDTATAAATPAGTPVVEVGTGQDQDSDNATPAATPEA